MIFGARTGEAASTLIVGVAQSRHAVEGVPRWRPGRLYSATRLVA
jgi:hypothetical protein